MAKKKSKAIGRPSTFTEELAAKICERIAAGEPLTKIVKGKGMPGYTTVMRWLDTNAEFRKNYARAREDSADALADEIIAIADSATAKNAHAVRVRVDARKWAASKMKPKKYGDKLDLTGDLKTTTVTRVMLGGAIPHGWPTLPEQPSG